MLSFRVPSEHADEGWWGGRSACQEAGAIVVEKLEWTPARKRSEPVLENRGGREAPRDRKSRQTPRSTLGSLHEPNDPTAPELGFLRLPSRRLGHHRLTSYSPSLLQGNRWLRCPMRRARGVRLLKVRPRNTRQEHHYTQRGSRCPLVQALSQGGGTSKLGRPDV